MAIFERIMVAVGIAALCSARSMLGVAHASPFFTSPRKRGEVKGTASHSRRACARVLPATSRPLIRGRGECRTLGAPAAK